MKKYKCDICGRPLNKKKKIYGYILCSKHMHQYHRYGKFLDNIQRTNNDLNDYVIKDDVAIFNLYNQKNKKIGEFIIDKEDLLKVKFHKWRISHNHVLTGTKDKNNVKDLSWVILGIEDIKDKVVDHINHDPFDNRKSNLRLCSQSDNTKNVKMKSTNTSGFVGVYWNGKRRKWVAEIKVNYRKIHLGEYKSLKKAVYARMLAEEKYFGEFKNKDEYLRKKEFTKDLSASEKVALNKRINKTQEIKKCI